MEEPRILVVGRKISNVASDDWDSAVLPNAADFTVAILDLSTIQPSLQRLTHRGVAAFTGLLKRLVASGGHVVALLPRPSTVTMIHSPSKPVQAKLPLHAFLPITINVAGERGETLQDVDADFRWYFDRLKYWEYHFTANGQLESEGDVSNGTIVPLAKNREGKHLAAQIKYPTKGSVTKSSAMTMPGGAKITSKPQASKR